MNIILPKPFGFKKLYETMLKLMPESTGWTVPRGLRSKRHTGGKERQTYFLNPGGVTEVIGEDIQPGTVAKPTGIGNLSGEVEHKSREVKIGGRVVNTYGSGVSKAGTSEKSSYQGPFCPYPMAISNLINPANDDPELCERKGIVRLNSPERSQEPDPKRRRLESMSQSDVMDSTPTVDGDTSPPQIDTLLTVSDYSASLTVGTPAETPSQQEQGVGDFQQIDRSFDKQEGSDKVCKAALFSLA